MTPLHDLNNAQIKNRRTGRPQEGADLFNAEIWVGQSGVDMGLADGLAHLVPKMKELYGDKTRFLPIGQKRSLMQRLGLSLTEDMARNLSQGIMAGAEDRALWARYGL